MNIDRYTHTYIYILNKMHTIKLKLDQKGKKKKKIGKQILMVQHNYSGNVKYIFLF